MDEHEDNVKRLIVYGHVKGSSICGERPLTERIKSAMIFVGYDVSDEKLVDQVRKSIYLMEKDAKG